MNISLSNSSIEFNSNEANAGCLPGLLRRLLCRNFNQVHSRTDNNKQQFVTEVKEEKKGLPRSPGLVARLMGLESMPVYPHTPTESIVRSRSTNSIEGWNGFLSGQRSWVSKHRSSHSFREEPTFLRMENEDFLLLSFTPEDRVEKKAKPKFEHEELKENERMEMGGKRRNGMRIGDKENAKPVEKKELYRKPRQNEVNGERSNRAMKKSARSSCRKKISEIECSSQNSSPVSVLDSAYLLGPDSPISGNTEEEKKPTKQEKPRRKHSSDLKTDSYPALKTEHVKNSKDESKRGKSSETRRQSFPNIWEQICRLTEEDVKRSCWNVREILRLEGNEETAVMMELELLDLLLCEVLTELSTRSLAI